MEQDLTRQLLDAIDELTGEIQGDGKGASKKKGKDPIRESRQIVKSIDSQLRQFIESEEGFISNFLAFAQTSGHSHIRERILTGLSSDDRGWEILDMRVLVPVN